MRARGHKLKVVCINTGVKYNSKNWVTGLSPHGSLVVFLLHFAKRFSAQPCFKSLHFLHRCDIRPFLWLLSLFLIVYIFHWWRHTIPNTGIIYRFYWRWTLTRMTIGALTKEADNTEISLKVHFVLLLFFASPSSQL